MKFYTLTLLSAAISCLAVEAWTGKCTGGNTGIVCDLIDGKIGSSSQHSDYGTQSCYGMNEATCKDGFAYWCTAYGGNETAVVPKSKGWRYSANYVASEYLWLGEPWAWEADNGP
ncbi:hypothetical protein BGX26_001201, partial [Mortierella sp. AD094]